MKNSKSYLRINAWKFILEQNICYLPVDPLQLAFQLGYHVLTYEQYARIVRKPVSVIIQQYDADGFSFWSARDSCFIITYNAMQSPASCRWTMMHEIAHIHLGHLSPHRPVFSRIRSDDRSLFEIEAQEFARRILCPSIVLHNCQVESVEELSQLCGLSRSAAVHRLSHLNMLIARQRFRTNPFEVLVEEQFEKFTQYYLRRKAMLNRSGE